MKDTALQILREQDSFAAIEYLCRQGDALTIVDAMDELMRDLYWKQKDLAASVALGRAGAQHALAIAARVASENPELAERLRGKAKAACFNLASFTWRGWDEPGVRVTASDEAIGLDAARANLRLARELNRGDLALSRAHWMLGAHQVSAQDYPAALESFRAAADHAVAAAARREELLALAFARLVEYLTQPADPGRRTALDEARGALASEKEGAALVGQVDAALSVFRPANG